MTKEICEFENRFIQIEKRLDKLVEKKMGKETYRLLKIFEGKPKWAFNINEIIKENFVNPYYFIKKLMNLGIIDRKWLKTEYKYYLVSEWEK